MNKLTSISTEDLLKELEKSQTPQEEKQETPKLKKKSDILKFLDTFNIEPGNHRINQNIIYQLYRNFSDDPTGKVKFYEHLKNYLNYTKGTRGSGFFDINQKSLDLSETVSNFLQPKKRPSLKVIPLQMHFNNFIKKYKIEAGEKPNFIWVSIKVLYDLYDEWVFEIRKKKPLGFREFTNFCKLYFPVSKQSNGKIWLMLNDSISELMKARNSFKNEKEKKPKE